MALQSNNIIVPQAFADKVAPAAPTYVTDLAVFPGPIGVQPIVTWSLPVFSQLSQGLAGVNIYRSYDNPFDGFEKINRDLVTVCVYNDNLAMRWYTEAPMAATVVDFRGRPNLVLRVSRQVFSNLFLAEDTSYLVPVSQNRSLTGTVGNFLNSVYAEVTFKGQRIHPSYVEGDLIYFDLQAVFNPNQTLTEIPVGAAADYLVTYCSSEANPYDLLMEHRIYYRVVAVNHKGEEIVPLNAAPLAEYNPTSDFAWVWKAALRRNFWLIFFGGEDSIIYLRKWAGKTCPCQQGRVDSQFECPTCLGTGFVGGYNGPYSVKVIFETTQQSRQVNDFGSRFKDDTRGILLPLPYLRTGDVMIRRNGQKMALGEIENITNRGVILQQEFSLGSCNNSLKFSLPNNRGYQQFYSIPDHPDQVNTQKGAQPTFSHLQLGLY